MMLKKVKFVSRWQAEALCPEKEHRAAIISVNSNYDLAKLHENWEASMYLVFEDLEKDYGMGHVLFNEVMARKVIEFLNGLDEGIKTIVVHCDAGISRSAAIAKFIADRYNLPFDKEYYLYNQLVYRILHYVDTGKVIEAMDRSNFSKIRESLHDIKDMQEWQKYRGNFTIF